MKRMLSVLTEELAIFGLRVNQGKSSVMSLIPSGREKKMKMISDSSFRIENTPLEQISVTRLWKYLGVEFIGCKLNEKKVNISHDIEMLEKAPLKPQQRLMFLRTVIVPRYLHSLILGRTNITKLKRYDRLIRMNIRKWMRFPNDTPLAYFYADVKSGGMGVPCLSQQVPIIKSSRLKKFLDKESTAANAVRASKYVSDQLKWCEATLSQIGGRKDRNAKTKFWEAELHSKYDTKELVHAKHAKPSSEWMSSKASEITGRDYIQYNHLRVGCLPTKTRTLRGRTAVKTCRAGCGVQETNYHVIQQCHRTHKGRLLRHDRVVGMISEFVKSAHESTVQIEPKFRTTEGLRKPDLVIVNDEKALVLDVQIVHGGDMQSDDDIKVAKYRDTPGLRQLIEAKYNRSNIEFRAFTLSYKGIISRDTEKVRREIRLSNIQMFQIVTSVLRGSYLNWIRFNQMTTMRRRR